MSTGSTYQDLAAHFMGAPPAQAAIGPGASPRMPDAPVLVTLCGNLPSMQGIWLAQLGERLARLDGPTGLVRIDDQRLRLDLLRAEGRAAPTDGSGLASACRFVRRWIVALPERHQPTDLTLARTELVVLTGCDEAALAAARLKLQEIGASLDAQAATARPVHLVTVAASQEVGAAAAGALCQWAEGRVPMPIRWCGSLERVDRLEGVVTAELKSRARASTASVVEELITSIDAAAARFDESPLPAAPARTEPPALDPPGGAGHAATPRTTPHQPIPKEPPMAATSFTDPDAPARAPRTEPTRSSLLAWFPEFVGLRIRPANAPSLELAIDMHGRLHLLSTDVSTRDLRVGRSWCTANWSLLSSAVVDLRNAAVPEMVDHLVLEEARHAVPLHGSGVLMHVGVEVAGQRRRIDLNDEASAGLAS